MSKSWTEHLITWLDDAERVLLSLVARLGPWLAPVGPAYFVARAAERHLSAARWAAISMAISIEAVGIASAHATLRAWAWNKEKQDGEPSAPAWLGLVLSTVYLVVGVGLAVLVEVMPWLVPFAPAAFFILAGVAYVALGMMADQARREALVAVERESATVSRRASRAFWATVRERGLSKAEAQRVLADAGGDYLAGMEMLPANRRISKSANQQEQQERVPEMDELLSVVAQRAEGPFGQADVQRWTGKGRSAVYGLLGYGQRMGVVARVGRGEYQVRNGRE